MFYSLPHGLGFGGTTNKADLESFRLFIPDTLENCFVRSNCLTFESGDLLSSEPPSESSNQVTSASMDSQCLSIPPSLSNSVSDPYNTSNQNQYSSSSGDSNIKYFDILALEVWACGGSDMINKGMESQQTTRKIKDHAIQKARQVDKAQFFNNPFDRENFLSKTTGGSGGLGNR